MPPGKSMSYALYKCEFNYEGISKILISQSSIEKNIRSYVGQYFPALYSKKYDELRILMRQEDFKEFGIVYPDSLIVRINDR